MVRPVKILLQSTIPSTQDDWSISRFSLLSEFLREQRDERDNALFEVTSRDRDALGAPDRVLSRRTSVENCCAENAEAFGILLNNARRASHLNGEANPRFRGSCGFV